MAAATPGLFGKYRAIIVAVAFFLVFDLGVLVLNFYTSFRIAEDAVMINLSGRQRMLSQRTAKSVFQVEEAVRTDQDPKPALAELRQAVQLFDSTLTAFRSGGAVTGSDAATVQMAGVRTDASRRVLDQAEAVWKPYLATLQPVLQGNYTSAELQTAVSTARERNTQLLGLMNELTTQLEQEATAQANWLRMVQTTGIVLALFNFAFILFKFLRQLRAADEQVERKEKENEDILRTVNEGLFLLGTDWSVGGQVSESTRRILGRAVEPGADFAAVLRKLLPAEAFDTARDYIGLLLSGRVKEALVAEINPLTAVEVRDDNHAVRYLTFRFNSVRRAGAITHLLVTVIDVTRTVELERELAEARRKARDDAAILLQLFRREPEVLDGFISRTEAAMNQANELLRTADARSARLTVDGVFRLVHALKGEAAALDLGYFEGLAERFEDQLGLLRERGNQLTNDDLLGLPLPVDEMFERIQVVRDTLANFQRPHGSATPAATSPATRGHELEPVLDELAQRIAREHGKLVDFTADLALLGALPAAQQEVLREICLQLVRNAVVHGIEPAIERQASGKPARGAVHLALHRAADQRLQLVARDDGRGIDPERIRSSLIESGRCSASAAAAMSDQQLIAQIFEAGVSTADTIDRHAGRGVGMDIVRDQVRRLGAHLRLSSRIGEFTSFRIALQNRAA